MGGAWGWSGMQKEHVHPLWKVAAGQGMAVGMAWWHSVGPPRRSIKLSGSDMTYVAQSFSGVLLSLYLDMH